MLAVRRGKLGAKLQLPAIDDFAAIEELHRRDRAGGANQAALRV
jgi:hypothetical protein